MTLSKKRFWHSDASLSLLYLPAIILMVIFVLVPLISGIQISFTNWNGYSQKYKYVGLANYAQLFSDKMFRTALINTIIYGLGSTLIQTILGLTYALFLEKKFAGRIFTRTVIYLPAMAAQVIIGYIWYFMVKYDRGALNDILMLLKQEPLDWMASGIRAVFIITGINAVAYVGKTMIIFIAGLQGIPVSFYEAAAIDGASYRQRLYYITLPQLMPAFTTSIILNVIGGLKLFGLVVFMTSGGPGYSSHSLSSLINTLYFSNQDAGYAAAVGMFTFVFIMGMSITIQRILKSNEVRAYA